MKPPESAAPIVVGIDGSPAAIAAALWATDEAIDRQVPLRLVHVIDIEDEIKRDRGDVPAEIAKDWPETQYGRTALRAASAAVYGTGKWISVETQIIWGEVDSMLIKESDQATMLCVGSVGISPVGRRVLGSTAAAVAERAHSSVAVIRSPHSPPTSEPDWIVTVVDDSQESARIAAFALDEAHLRSAPVLALGVPQHDSLGVHHDALERRVASWRDDHPQLHIYPVAVPTDVAGFLELHDDLSVQLVVVGAADAKRVPAIVGPHCERLAPRSRCSVLVVR